MIEALTAACEHFGKCGGCSRQNLSYPDQLVRKETVVRQGLRFLSVQNFHPILPSPDQYFYRNKMEFSFGNEKDLQILKEPVVEPRVHLGLHPKGRFALVTPTPACQLLSEESRKICAIVENWATTNNVSVYVRKSGLGDLRHLVVREGKNTGERLVNLVARSQTPSVDKLAEDLRKAGDGITTFLWTSHDGLSDVARGDSSRTFWGTGTIFERIGKINVRVNSSSFMQTNTRAAESMINQLAHWLSEGTGRRKIIDLYCGSGAIGLNLVEEGDALIGIEINKEAIEDAKWNASHNNIKNALFLDGKAEDLVGNNELLRTDENTVVVVDPPRPGLHPKVLETLLQWEVPTMFYVSCNPETLARDLKGLAEKYDIVDVQPMDFFPHTDHIETAVRLKIKNDSI